MRCLRRSVRTIEVKSHIKSHLEDSLGTKAKLVRSFRGIKSSLSTSKSMSDESLISTFGDDFCDAEDVLQYMASLKHKPHFLSDNNIEFSNKTIEGVKKRTIILFQNSLENISPEKLAELCHEHYETSRYINTIIYLPFRIN